MEVGIVLIGIIVCGFMGYRNLEFKSILGIGLILTVICLFIGSVNSTTGSLGSLDSYLFVAFVMMAFWISAWWIGTKIPKTS